MSSTRRPNTSRGWFFKDIPAEWESLPLKYACDLTSEYGANIPADRYASEGIRFLRTSDINDNGDLATGGVFVSEADAAEYLLAERDLLISRSGTLGRTFLYSTSHGPCAYAGYLIRYRLRQSFHPRYVFYVTKSAGFQEWIGTVATEATIGNVNGEKYANFSLPAPGFETQLLIANYLDRETARIDRLIAEKERMLALLNEKRSALISRVVTRGLDANASLKPSGLEWLGEIPAHWGLQRLKQLAEVRGGLTLGKQYSGALVQYPYLRVANVQDGYLNLNDILTIDVPASEARSSLLAYGDVLMNEGGDIDKLGRGCVWRDEIVPCLHQNHVFAVRPHSVDADWLALWTSTLQAKRYFESRAKRSTNLASISGWNVKELPIPLPPVAEQLAIHKFLADQHSRHEALCNELRDSLRLLTERRVALITAAVTGQIPLEVMVR